MQTFVVHSNGAVALAAATTKTLVGIQSGATQRHAVFEIGVSFDGVDTTKAPIEVQLTRFTSVGTSTGTTPLYEDPLAGSTLGQWNHTYTAEPTKGSVLRRWYVSPAGGVLVIPFPSDRPIIQASLNTSMGLVAITATGVTCNALAYMVCGNL